MGWEVVRGNNYSFVLDGIKKGDNIKVIDKHLKVEIDCIVKGVNSDSLTLTNKESIKEIEIDGKQIPFAYGMIWLEDGSEIYSKEGIYKENDYYCCELESMDEIKLLCDSLLDKTTLPIKVTTKSDRVIECNFICNSYSGGYCQMNEYELQQLQ